MRHLNLELERLEERIATWAVPAPCGGGSAEGSKGSKGSKGTNECGSKDHGSKDHGSKGCGSK
jgi:hypothetical protein